MKATKEEEREQMMVTASFAIAALTDAAVFSLPISAQNRISDVTHSGGHLAVLTVMNPLPEFVVMLMHPHSDPVEICRCAPPVEALVTNDTMSH